MAKKAKASKKKAAKKAAKKKVITRDRFRGLGLAPPPKPRKDRFRGVK